MNALTTSSTRPSVAAVVVGFRPDRAVLQRLLGLLSPQVDFLYLVDNGGCESLDLSGLSNCSHIKLGKNFGLGYALNIGFQHALAAGAEYVATFDQDSEPPSDLIAHLLDEHLQLQAQSVACAAVSPLFFDRRETRSVNFPVYRERNKKIAVIYPVPNSDEIIETDTLITSGMLIKASVWQDQLAYDDGLFVDLTDTEWCFRARSRGYRLFVSPKTTMGHALSDAPPIRRFNLNFFRYSPLRRYYYVRNTILFCKAPYVSSNWKRRLYIGLAIKFVMALLYEENRLTQFKMMLRGIWDGLRNKRGAYE
jgi:rhamnosyltransferase